MSIRILLADDNAVLREGLAALIARRQDMELIAQATDGREAVQLYREHTPDIVLMDLQMPQIDGIEAINVIRAEFPLARVIVLTSYLDDEDIRRSIDAGAVGFLMKDASRAELWDAISAVNNGESRIPPTAQRP